MSEDDTASRAYDPFLSFLMTDGLLSPDQADTVMYAWRVHGMSVDQACVRMGFVEAVTCLAARARFMDTDVVAVADVVADEALVQQLSRSFCREACVVPLGAEQERVNVAISSALSPAQHDVLTQAFPGKRMQCRLAERRAILVALKVPVTHTSVRTALASEQLTDVAQGVTQEIANNKAANNATSYKMPLRLWQQLLDEAVLKGASDVHGEPGEGCVRLFYRLDGVRHALMVMPADVWAPLVSCLKVMCQLDVTVTRLPQQGRMTREIQGQEVDFRCTTHPTLWGEKVVVRLLAPSSLDLGHLGFSAAQAACLQTVLKMPEGLVVVSGPTGSGKTTTLHAMTRGYVEKCLAVLSLEDPPEYRLPGVMQTAVAGDGQGPGLSFEEGVASALRQDIDVLLLGEVRSGQAAHMAMRAAMTGHQVLTSVHTPDALAVIDRLVELGVSPHYLAAYVKLLVNQRLVRLLCAACKVCDSKTGFYHARGCEVCSQTGYKGRTVVAQLVPVDETLQSWILRRGHSDGVFRPALEVATLAAHAHEKLRAGLIDCAECRRVLGPDFSVPDVEPRCEKRAA